MKNVIDNKDLLMASLAKYFSIKQNFNKIWPVIVGQSIFSLRLVDWFVTNYSKKYGVIITNQVANNVVHFNVYLSYRSQLKAFSKQQFDPFRRRDRITFFYEKNKSIETTVGQLNFFRWVVDNNILEYINSNYDKIESDMIITQRENNKKKQSTDVKKQRKTRSELSRSFAKNMNLFDGSCKVCFN